MINTGSLAFGTTAGGSAENLTATAPVVIQVPVLSLVKTNSPTGPIDAAPVAPLAAL